MSENNLHAPIACPKCNSKQEPFERLDAIYDGDSFVCQNCNTILVVLIVESGTSKNEELRKLSRMASSMPDNILKEIQVYADYLLQRGKKKVS